MEIHREPKIMNNNESESYPANSSGLRISSKSSSDLSKDFWKTRLSPKPSTFGASAKRPAFRPSKSEIDLVSDTEKWKVRDDYCFNHGRYHIATAVLGKLSEGNPGVGQHSPVHESGSVWIKGKPKAFFCSRYPEHVDMITPSPLHYDLSQSLIDPNNIDRPVIRNTLPVPKTYMSTLSSPSPTAYGFMDINKSGKFEADPATVMPPRSSSFVRSKLIIQTVETDNGQTPGPGEYSPVIVEDTFSSKRYKGITIGESLPLMGAKEILPASHSDIDTSLAFPFAGPTVLSHSPSKYAYSRTETMPNFSKITNNKKSFSDNKRYGDYKSNYDFPKPIIDRQFRGKRTQSSIKFGE